MHFGFLSISLRATNPEILYEEPAAYFLKAVGNEDFEIKKTEN